MKKKLHIILTAQAAILAAITAHGGLIVHEGFDTTLGASVWGQGTGIGWDGNWTGTGTDALGDPVIGDGLSFGTLQISGGSYRRPVRNGVAQSSRVISAASKAALTADNSTIWFSVLMKSNPGGTTGGYAANSNGAIVLGNTAFTTANPGSIPPTIGTGGNAVGVSFFGNSTSTNIAIQGVTYKNGVTTMNSTSRPLVGNNTVMVVGKIEWAANGTNDVVSLYRITNPSAELPAAFSTMTVDLDQSTFNVVATAQGQTEIFDEIRFGESLQDVVPLDGTAPALVGTSPSNFATEVPITDNLVATFNETIALGTTGDVTIRNLSDSTDIVISLPGPDPDGTLSVSGSVLTINPTANLDLGDQYAIQIGSTVVKDVAGNSYVGINDTSTWSFTTSTLDIYPPTPSPMTFVVAPAGISETEITMTATTATDASGVEYLFTNTTNSSTSGWQSSTTWTDSGLSPDTPYSYTVKARDLSANQLETTASAVAVGFTFPDIVGDEILATVFAGRTISSTTATINDFTLNGVLNPGSLIVQSVPGSTITVTELFDTTDAKNFFAPKTNSSSAHWQVDVPLFVGGNLLSLGNIELYMQSFSSSGGRKLTPQVGYQDHFVTVALFDSNLNLLGSQQIEAPSGSQNDYKATFNFARGMDLAPNMTYSLRILVSGSDPATPANAGNYVGIDAIRVLTKAASPGTPFNDWQSANFPGNGDPDTIGPNADPDKDGVDNLVEYALHTDPNEGAAMPVIPVSAGEADCSIHYTKVAAATDVTYIVEWSTNLSDWFSTGITEVTDPEPAVDSDYPVIKATVSKGTDAAKFMRVRVEQAP